MAIKAEANKSKDLSKPEMKEEKIRSESKFPLTDLRRNCLVLFGVTTSTFDGAAYGKQGYFSIAEMAAIITKWKGQK